MTRESEPRYVRESTYHLARREHGRPMVTEGRQRVTRDRPDRDYRGTGLGALGVGVHLVGAHLDLVGHYDVACPCTAAYQRPAQAP